MWQSKLDNLNSATDMIQNVIQKPYLLVALMEVHGHMDFYTIVEKFESHDIQTCSHVKEKTINRDLKEREACLKVSFCQLYKYSCMLILRG